MLVLDHAGIGGAEGRCGKRVMYSGWVTAILGRLNNAAVRSQRMLCCEVENSIVRPVEKRTRLEDKEIDERRALCSVCLFASDRLPACLPVSLWMSEDEVG